MELSRRLHAVASLVTEGASVADIGTDHGYIPIWLAKRSRNPYILAMDINEGPLSRAREHIQKYQLEDIIQTRISDGLKALRPGEVDTVILAGMGGGLVIKILEEEKCLATSMESMVLQPQSEMKKVRQYLVKEGYCVQTEDMVEEEGKYYPILKVVRGVSSAYSEAEYLYGKKLLAHRHPVLRAYLEGEWKIKNNIVNVLRAEGTEQLQERIWQVCKDMQLIQALLDVW